MILQYLSNILLDAAVLIVLGATSFAFLIGPRLKGRRTYNLIVRRIAKHVHPPKAAISKSGPMFRRTITVTWSVVIGPKGDTVPAEIKLIVSAGDPNHVIFALDDGDNLFPLANFTWTWVSLWRMQYPNWRALKRALTGAVRIHLDTRARQGFPDAKSMADATLYGYLGLPLDVIAGY